ncbi:helix-turn-helix domain-containing protein [Nonomuraea sp. B19D2]|uniref:helix-turn-helix domain-containing protein n=1 Tax=Nonomuraea sp. B19D2 TaxID=3159561 RepID=UPI0032DBDB93
MGLRREALRADQLRAAPPKGGEPGASPEAVRITYWIAPGRRIILLTVFRKQRMRETAEIERAVRLRREELGLTQADLAERAGLKQPAVARFEAGAPCPAFLCWNASPRRLRCGSAFSSNGFVKRVDFPVEARTTRSRTGQPPSPPQSQDSGRATG